MPLAEPDVRRVAHVTRIAGARHAGAGTPLRVLGPAGVLHTRRIAAADERVRLRLRVAPGDFIRAELRAGRRLLALTNPVYLR